MRRAAGRRPAIGWHSGPARPDRPARQEPGFAMDDEVPIARNVGGHHRHTPGHGLEDGVRQSLVAARVPQQVEVRQQPGHIVPQAQEVDVRVASQQPRKSLQLATAADRRPGSTNACPTAAPAKCRGPRSRPSAAFAATAGQWPRSFGCRPGAPTLGAPRPGGDGLGGRPGTPLGMTTNLSAGKPRLT